MISLLLAVLWNLEKRLIQPMGVRDDNGGAALRARKPAGVRIPQKPREIPSTNFWVFFPSSPKAGNDEKVINIPVPEHARQTSTFRTGVVDPTTGKLEVWWLWGGDSDWRIGNISYALAISGAQSWGKQCQGSVGGAMQKLFEFVNSL